MFMNVFNGYNMKTFTNVIKATFHVDRPRFGGWVDKRIFVHLRDKNMIGKFAS